jgi:hypothetical protein
LTDIADPKLLHHREADVPGSDFRRVRHYEEKEVIIKRNGTFGKVMVALAAIVFPIMVALIGGLIVRDRATVDADLSALKAAKEAQALQLQQVKTIQERVLLDLGVVKAGLDKNAETLNLILIETRKGGH